MKKIKSFVMLMTFVLLCSLTLAACNPGNGGKDGGDVLNGTVLIAFFSRADENYNVGYIEKGNTHIIAEIIEDFTDGNCSIFNVAHRILQIIPNAWKKQGRKKTQMCVLLY